MMWNGEKSWELQSPLRRGEEVLISVSWGLQDWRTGMHLRGILQICRSLLDISVYQSMYSWAACHVGWDVLCEIGWALSFEELRCWFESFASKRDYKGQGWVVTHGVPSSFKADLNWVHVSWKTWVWPPHNVGGAVLCLWSWAALQRLAPGTLPTPAAAWDVWEFANTSRTSASLLVTRALLVVASCY